MASNVLAGVRCWVIGAPVRMSSVDRADCLFHSLRCRSRPDQMERANVDGIGYLLIGHVVEDWNSELIQYRETQIIERHHADECRNGRSTKNLKVNMMLMIANLFMFTFVN